MTLPAACWSAYQVWAEVDGRLAPRTVDKSLRYLRFFEKRGLDLDPDRLTRAAILEFLAAARSAGRAPPVLNLWVTQLNRWIRFARLDCERIPTFRHHHVADVPAPSREEAQRLWALTWRDPSTSGRNRAVLAVLLDKGIRRQEIIDLNLTDFIQTRKGPSLIIRRGKGEKERTVPLHPEAAARLQTYLDTYRIASDDVALFTTPRGRISHGYIGKIVKVAGEKARIPWISPHKLRHFATDDMLDRGVAIESAAYILGHEKVETTIAYRSKRLRRELAEDEVRTADRGRFRSPGAPKAPRPNRLDDRTTGAQKKEVRTIQKSRRNRVQTATDVGSRVMDWSESSTARPDRKRSEPGLAELTFALAAAEECQ
ncbi:MAG TPA: tyrosine-type recombinase/integrase [Thermoplasmata archaeon]|nr:tyrosine-type recombinase/integrase [Thermoplasmata archaeon]